MYVYTVTRTSKRLAINNFIYGCYNTLETQCKIEHIILFIRANPESEENEKGSAGTLGK